MQEGRAPEQHPQHGVEGNYLILNHCLERCGGTCNNPDVFMLEITKIIQNKHAYPVIAQMLHPDVRDDLPPSECAPAPSESQSSPPTQFQ